MQDFDDVGMADPPQLGLVQRGRPEGSRLGDDLDGHFEASEGTSEDGTVAPQPVALLVNDGGHLESVIFDDHSGAVGKRPVGDRSTSRVIMTCLLWLYHQFHYQKRRRFC